MKQADAVFSGMPLHVWLKMDRRVDAVEPQVCQQMLQSLLEGVSIKEWSSSAGKDSKLSMGLLPFRRINMFYMDQMASARLQAGAIKAAVLLFPLAGKLSLRQGKNVSHVTRGEVLAVYPHAGFDISWECGAQLLIVCVPETSLMCYWSDYFDGAFSLPSRQVRVLSCSSKSGYALYRLMGDIMMEYQDEHSLFMRNMTLEAVESRLIITILDILEKKCPPSAVAIKPRYLTKALRYILDHEQENISLAELENVACVSQRTLQTGFYRFYGVTPMSYIRRHKLTRVRQILSNMQDGQGNIGDIAADWGFYHFSNFSRNYKALFGECPSETINRQLSNNR